jgi:hypothetical protein
MLTGDKHSRLRAIEPVVRSNIVYVGNLRGVFFDEESFDIDAVDLWAIWS